jgi:hypothetical protein
MPVLALASSRGGRGSDDVDRGLGQAIRTHPLAAWIVTRDEAAYPGEFVARLMTSGPTPYVMLADTLAGLQAQLPTGLTRTDCQPPDPPEVVEVWFPAS